MEQDHTQGLGDIVRALEAAREKPSPSPRKLVIDRSRWYRGQGAEGSRLIREEDGKMCCLGFLGLACGIPAEHLQGYLTPSAVAPKHIGKWPTGLFIGGTLSTTCELLMHRNDAPAYLPSVREELLQEAFETIGIEVEFVGEEKVTP